MGAKRQGGQRCYLIPQTVSSPRQADGGSPGVSSPSRAVRRRDCAQCPFPSTWGRGPAASQRAPSAAVALQFLPRLLQKPCLYSKGQGSCRSSEKQGETPPVESGALLRCAQGKGSPCSLCCPHYSAWQHPAGFQDRNRDPFPLGTRAGELADEFLT